MNIESENHITELEAEVERLRAERDALEAELVQAKLEVARRREAYQELGEIIEHAKCNLLGLKEKAIPDVRAHG